MTVEPLPRTAPRRAPVPAALELRPHVPAAPRDERALRNRRFFDAYWRGGRKDRDALWRAWWQEAYEQLLAWAGPLAGKRVVNLFAGLGEDAAMFAALGADVVAVDFSLPGLRHAARGGAQVGVPPVAWLCSDAARLPLQDASADVVIAINGLCHTDHDAVLAECRRILAPGGRILLLEVMRYPHVAMLARVLEPYVWRAPHRFVSVGAIEALAPRFASVRHREFFCASVLSAMLLRLPLGPRLFWPLHRLLMAADRRLLARVPALRRISYLCVAELRP